MTATKKKLKVSGKNGVVPPSTPRNECNCVTFCGAGASDIALTFFSSLTWDDTMVKAFQDTMRALARAANDVTMCQRHSQWTRLRPLERRYCIFDRELLALYLGLQHFRYFLE